ncbi:MAG TPA: SAM-dependent methyltransferase [Methanoregulaceae archaeon]|nr:SAM-dependent methyltransferase [Methanoregulaceae archaeon]
MVLRVRQVPVSVLCDSLQEDWVDATKKPFVKGDTAFIPVKEHYHSEGVLDRRKPYQGRGYHMIGDVALVRGRKPSAEELENLVSWRKPRGVLWIRSVQGDERIPESELVYGTAGEVIHREQGLSYVLDPSKVMFSQGNRPEKVRMAALVRPGEAVADMFAGIGYFSIPMAHAGAVVHAMEINPVAFRYLEINTRLNHLEAVLEPECGDCRLLLDGYYDRIVMGHFSSRDMVSDALEHVHRGSKMHIHSSGKVPPEIAKTIEEAGYDPIIVVRTVKKTGPGNWHFVQDVVLR